MFFLFVNILLRDSKLKDHLSNTVDHGVSFKASHSLASIDC